MSLISLSKSILICMILSTGNPTGISQQPTGASAIKVPLCEVLTHPNKYSGSNLIVTARFTATKEGTDLWDHDCPGLGVDLLENPAVDSHPDMVELYRMLKEHGLSDHPVMATVTGQFKDDHHDSAHDRKRWVFIVVAATDIGQTHQVERRSFKASSAVRPLKPTVMYEKQGSSSADSSAYEGNGHAQGTSAP